MAFSCEPKRQSPYSVDLRWRMVWQVCILGQSSRNVGRNLSVDPTTVSRIVRLFKETGSVNHRQHKGTGLKKLSSTAEVIIIHLVLSQPGIYLSEIKEELKFYGYDVSEGSICRCLHSMNFTRQKMHIIAAQQDRGVRELFVRDVSLYTAEMIVFIDETGADRRDAMREYGYSLRGHPAHHFTPYIRGDRINAIAAMNISGLLDVCVLQSTVDSDDFCQFIDANVLPKLMPFNGHNPNSVVIMDNCSIHHVEYVMSMITQVGAMLHFLPPYSPDYNPIEMMFSKVKSTLKALDKDTVAVDMHMALLSAFSHVTESDCYNWVDECGIYSM